MTCQEIVEFLMAYLDGELEQETRSTFEKHVGLCPPCEDYLRSYQEAIRLGKVCEAEDAPVDVPDRLVQAILAARKKTD